MYKIIKIVCIIIPFICLSFFILPHIEPFYQISELCYLKDVILEDPAEKASDFFNQKRYADTQNFIEFYRDLPGAKMTHELEDLLRQAKEERSKIKYITNEMIYGFFLGKSQETYGEYAKIISDLTSVGDVRDLINEGYNFATDKEVDIFVVALASISVSLNLFPAIAPQAKTGLSILRTAKRTKAISSKMQKEILLLSKKGAKLENLIDILLDLSKFIKTYGLSSTIELLKFCDSIHDIPKVIKTASKFGKDAGKFLKFGGKDVVEVASKQGTDFVRYAIGYGENAVSALKKSPGRILTKDVPRFRRLLQNFGGWLFDAMYLATHFIFFVIIMVLSFIPLLLLTIFSFFRKAKKICTS